MPRNPSAPAHPDAIPAWVGQRFSTLVAAVKADRVALLSCKCATTGEPRYVMCAINPGDDDSIEMVPFGHVSTTENPFEDYLPPDFEKLA